jgi:hypothetical protein
VRSQYHAPADLTQEKDSCLRPRVVKGVMVERKIPTLLSRIELRSVSSNTKRFLDISFLLKAGKMPTNNYHEVQGTIWSHLTRERAFIVLPIHIVQYM